MNWLIVADKKPRRDKKMSEIKLNTPIKLNEAEECECCGEPAYYHYKLITNSDYNNYCEDCLKSVQESDREYLENHLEAIEQDLKFNEIYNLIEKIENEIDCFLSNKDIVFEKVKSKMSLSTYFEFEVDGVNKKIRVSDHKSRHTYNFLNGQADYDIAVGYRSGEASFEVLEEKDIEVLISKLNKKYFNK